jgi:hypothetical protein
VNQGIPQTNPVNHLHVMLQKIFKVMKKSVQNTQELAFSTPSSNNGHQFDAFELK